ncbi:MAG: glycoside-pentoside-hexuronide (GPH):cation symporter [Spirochaetes bacterium]|nr:glycoside-pentoside-hexuronide (GPH):cation symporter [Spirochaetota bacterium]MBU0954184.1 glycoside-pentoside-hexuronide (GPH):cation symporter [Spirochaetota bacterium]
MQVQDGLGWRERAAFVAGGFGQNMVITFVTTFMLVYLYEGVGFSAGGVAVLTAIIAGAKVFDAFTDLMMGIIVDRARSRWGKLRPWLLITPAPIALLTVLLFAVPGFSEAGRIAWFAIVYILWGLFYTMCDVPYWGLTGAMTTGPQERTGLIAGARMAGTFALAVVILGAPPLATALATVAGSTAAGWTWAAILVSVSGMGLFALIFPNVRERIKVDAGLPSVKVLIARVGANRLLLRVLAGSILSFGSSIIQVGGAVVAVVIFGDANIFTLLGAGIIGGIAIATLVAPLILKRMALHHAVVASNVLSALVSVVLWLLGFTHLWAVVLLFFVLGFASGIFIVGQTAMVAESVDWLAERTGLRTEGIAFAGLTFVSKVMGALATFAFGIAVALVGYGKGVAITENMRSGLWMAITLLPAASCLLGAAVFMPYARTKANGSGLTTESAGGPHGS